MGSLFALIGLQRFFIDPLGSATANLVLFFAQVLPLLVLAPSVAAGRPTAYFWGSLASTLYLVHGVLQVTALETRILGVFGIVFAVGWFVTSVLGLKMAPRRGE
jgi:uncharacterized membrane protein